VRGRHLPALGSPNKVVTAMLLSMNRWKWGNGRNCMGCPVVGHNAANAEDVSEPKRWRRQRTNQTPRPAAPRARSPTTGVARWGVVGGGRWVGWGCSKVKTPSRKPWGKAGRWGVEGGGHKQLALYNVMGETAPEMAVQCVQGRWGWWWCVVW